MFYNLLFGVDASFRQYTFLKCFYMNGFCSKQNITSTTKPQLRLSNYFQVVFKMPGPVTMKHALTTADYVMASMIAKMAVMKLIVVSIGKGNTVI